MYKILVPKFTKPNLIREKLLNSLSYEKGLQKLLMKLTPGHVRISLKISIVHSVTYLTNSSLVCTVNEQRQLPHLPFTSVNNYSGVYNLTFAHPLQGLLSKLLKRYNNLEKNITEFMT